MLCDSGVFSLPLVDRFTARLGPLHDAQQKITILHVMSQMSTGPGVGGEPLQQEAEELSGDYDLVVIGAHWRGSTACLKHNHGYVAG